MKNRMLPGGIGALSICYSQIIQSYCPIYSPQTFTALRQFPLYESVSMYAMHTQYTKFKILVKYFFAYFP